MAQVAPIQTSFNGGALSPRMRGRVDQAVYANSCSAMVGVIPLLQGPAEFAPGTIFVAQAKGAARLIPFEFNVTQGYQIEAGAGYFRFFTNDAQIMDGAEPYEIETPYTAEQVSELEWEQSFDALYLFHRDVAPRRLVRTDADSFVLEDLDLADGPWEPRNENRARTISFSGTTGSVTVFASFPAFTAGDIGGLLEVETSDFDAIPSWQAGIQSTTGQIRQWGGRVYRNDGGTGRTGDLAPTHVEGTEWDGISTGNDINGKGPYGVKWTYLYDRWGQVRFTGFTSATQMTAVVERTLPGPAASWRWRFGAFSARRGFPQGGRLWQDRLALFKDNTVHASVASDYTNFAIRNEFGDFSQDMAFSVDLPSADVIRWLMPGDDLLVGTASAEYAVGERAGGNGVGPGQVRLRSPSANGSASVRPIKVDGRVVFLQRAKKRLLQFPFGGQELYRQESPDLTRYADHIGISAIEDIVYQAEPDRLLWARRADGTLALAAYMPEEALLGWAERPLASGLSVSSISANTDPDGRFQQLWLIAAAGEEHWVMRMEQIRQAGDASADRVMTDASVIYQGEATDQIAAPHLAGRTVDIVADGRVLQGVVLDEGGEASLPFAASSIIAGLPFDAYFTTFDHEGGSGNGTAQNKLRRISRIDLLLEQSDGLEITCQGVTRKLELGTTTSPTNTGFPLFSGAKGFEIQGNHARTGPITVRRYLPRPATVLALIAYQQVGEA
jgi:hypothetical protein